MKETNQSIQKTNTKGFSSSFEYILSAISSSIGLGNVWRFPFLVFKSGGAAFLIPFFIMLFIIGIPMFFLETAIGQFSGVSPIEIFGAMCPIFQGVGIAAIITEIIIGLYYAILVTYILYYFIFSIRAELPWSKCQDDFKNCFECIENSTLNCSAQKEEFLQKYNTSRSPSQVYFYDKVLNLSNDITEVGQVQWRLLLCLLVVWTIVFLILFKGAKILGKASYVTSFLPYVIFLALVIQGSLLEGSGIGVDFYILNVDFEKLKDPNIWKDAASQVFFSLSCCLGMIPSLSSYVKFEHNLVLDTFLVPIVDTLTGFFAGFAIFTVLGHMYITSGAKSFSEVAKQGPELTFVVYPEGISLMGKIAPLISVLFFLTMLMLGLGSLFPLVETTIAAILNTIKNKYKNVKYRDVLIRFSVCLVYFLIGIVLCTESGFYIFDFLDSFIASIPLLIVGIFQLISVGWFYGTHNLIRDIELMSGKRNKFFWLVFILLWKIISPIAILVILISSIVSLKGYSYPSYVTAIGWLITATPCSAIPICALYQLYKNWNNKINLFKAQKIYYNHANQMCPNLEKEIEQQGFRKEFIYLKSIFKRTKISPNNSQIEMNETDKKLSTEF